MPSAGALSSAQATHAFERNAFPRVPGRAQLLRNYAELFKIRITATIGATAWCGASLAAHEQRPVMAGSMILGPVLAITALAAGSAALNEVVERDSDANMLRTANRPIVAGRISVVHAITISLALSLCALTYLALRTNLLTVSLAFLTAATYLAIYTPLKKITPHCTTIGAIPGAMPAVLGWVAVRGSLGLEPLALFAVVFFWQFPHFYAIALLHHDDYDRAGIRMLPFADRDGMFTIALIRTFSIILILASLGLGLFDKHPVTYISMALLLGMCLFAATLSLSRKRTQQGYGVMQFGARRVVRATIIYLIGLFAILMVTQA